MLVSITYNQIIFTSERGSCEKVTIYALPSDGKVIKKVHSYKTVRGLLAYCEKNLTLVSHHDPLNEPVPEISPTVTTDNKTLSDDGSSALGVVASEGEALFEVECSHCGMQLGVEDSPVPDVLCETCHYELNPKNHIPDLPQRFSRDDLMIIRLCTSDRLEKLYKDAPFCNYANQHLINDVIALRGQIDNAIADLDNHIQETIKALDNDIPLSFQLKPYCLICQGECYSKNNHRYPNPDFDPSYCSCDPERGYTCNYCLDID